MNIITSFIFIIITLFIIIVIKKVRLPAKIKKAEEYINNNDIQKAIEILKKILEKNSKYVPAKFLRAQILITQNQYLLAISELNGILSTVDFKNFVNEIDIRNELVELYNKTGQWQKEVQEYKSILDIEPDNIIANNRIGQILFKQKDYKNANDHLAKTLSEDPSQTECYLPFGISFYYLSQYEEAEINLKKVIESFKEQYEAYFYLGLIYKQKKEFDEALQMFEISTKDTRYYIKSLYATGEIHFNASKYEDAIEVLTMGLNTIQMDKDNEFLDYRYLLAESYKMNSNLQEAMSQWEFIVKIKPGYRDVLSKIDEHIGILENNNLKTIFSTSPDALQSLIKNILNSLNYSITAKNKINNNEYIYNAFNTKRVNDPPTLVYFNRTTKDIPVEEVNNFYKLIIKEKCGNGIYITTAEFTQKAKKAMASKNVELIGSNDLLKMLDLIGSRKSRP